MPLQKFYMYNDHIWSYEEHPENITAISEPREGYIYVGDTNGSVYKIDIKNGEKKWVYSEQKDTIRSLSIDQDGYVYSLSEDYTLHKIDPIECIKLWEYDHANTIRFYEEDGVTLIDDGITPNPQRLLYNEFISYPTYDPEEEGYFVWNETPSVATEDTDIIKTELSSIYQRITGTQTKWEQGKLERTLPRHHRLELDIKGYGHVHAQYFEVSFIDYQGNIIKVSDGIELGESATPPSEEDVPAPDGFRFSHWDRNFDSIFADITVHAVYELMPLQVTFYEKDMETVFKIIEVEYLDGVSPPDYDPGENNIFMDWDKELKEVRKNIDVYPIVYTPSYINITNST